MQKNMQKEMEAKKRQKQIEIDKERKIDEYEEIIQKKAKKILEFEKTLADKRSMHATSQDIRHVQSQDLWDADSQLNSIDEKNYKAQDKKLRLIRRRTSFAQRKNAEMQARLIDYYRTEEIRNKEKEKELILQHMKTELKVEKHFKASSIRKQEVMLRNRMKSESSLVNRHGENMNYEKNMSRLTGKLKQSEKNISKFKQQKDHDFYLKRELRRLKEEDFIKMKERQKRLEFNRKCDILNKEQKHDEYIKKNKTQMERYKNSRMQEAVKEMFYKQEMYRTLQNINQSMSPKSFIKSQNIDLNVTFRSPPKTVKKED
jgi:hypothetical protein